MSNRDRPTPRDPRPAVPPPLPRIPVDEEGRAKRSPAVQPRGHTPVSIYSQPSARSLPPPSADPKDAQIVALRLRAEEAERRAQSPASVPPNRGDWDKLRYKVATAIVAALVLVIGALAYWGVAAINAKTEAIKAAQEAKKKAEGRDEQWRQWASVAVWIVDCRNDQQLEVNEALLPAPDHMGSARKQEPWIVKCPKKLPPPP